MLVLGDKPIDATMVAAYPAPALSGTPVTALTFGFLNAGRDEAFDGPAAAQLAAHCEAFDVVPKQGTDCSFAPVSALLRELVKETSGS